MDPKLPNELAVIDIGGNTINLALFLRQYDQAGIIKTYKMVSDSVSWRNSMAMDFCLNRQY